MTAVSGHKRTRARATPGRPTKLTRELHDLVVADLAIGAYVEDVMAANKVHRQLYYEWLKRGAKDRAEGKKTIYSDFADDVECATARAKVEKCRQLDLLVQHGRPEHGTKLAAVKFWLERRDTPRWGKRIAVSELTPEQFAKMGDDELAVEMARSGVSET